VRVLVTALLTRIFRIYQCGDEAPHCKASRSQIEGSTNCGYGRKRSELFAPTYGEQFFDFRIVFSFLNNSSS